MGFFSDFFHAVTDGLTGEDGLMGFIVSLFMLAVFVLVGVMILYGMFCFADTVGQDKQNGVATVIGKEFIAAHCDTTYINSGNNVMVPITTCYDDEWRAKVTMGNDNSSASISKQFYDNLQNGEKVFVTYRTGRFSGGFYAKSIDGKAE